ncbi:EscU/YscU/HrcU family type III secretion system export apparatus switch protein [Niallia sp. Krafla_26]|uniref:EscU/YscU/HrcU family type III secretion system export apparatus switch protein n=1 Tax=Niallia sp. Krafla_26 TaxID=3064703 RepID=UPI003D1708D0
MSKEMSHKRAAVALNYDEQEMTSPTVIAKGKGEIAKKIVEQAKASGIPIQEDPTLVELLSELNINQQIPEDLYKVVAEVFAFIYRLDQKQMVDNKELHKN